MLFLSQLGVYLHALVTLRAPVTRGVLRAGGDMRLAFHILGTEVFAVEFGTPEADDEQPYDTGYTTSMPVGFVRPEIPWDVDGSYHQFDPSEDSEDV